MRGPILWALLVKEVQRHVANRGGIVLCLLLIVSALLLSVFNPGTGAGGTGGGALVGGVHRCLVQYGEETPFIRALRDSVPPELRPHVVFDKQRPERVEGMMTYAPGTGAIQVRTTNYTAADVAADAAANVAASGAKSGGDSSAALRPPIGRDKPPVGRDKLPVGLTYHIDIWYPPEHPEAMAPYEAWFWPAARDALAKQADAQLAAAGSPGRVGVRDAQGDDLWAVRDSLRQLKLEYARLAAQTPGTPNTAPLPEIEMSRSGLGAKELDLRSAIATGMVVFALYFFCVYLLPTMTCEERERGTLLAQALSPASPAEILAAKFLFYPTLGVALAATLAGIYKPAILSTLFFWLSLLAMGCGFLGIGMTVATLARTQRAAFMGSMCYLMSVALILFICQQNGIPFVPYLAIEFHGPRVIHAAISEDVQWHHWLNLLAAAGIACVWMGVAAWQFRRRGWQ